MRKHRIDAGQWMDIRISIGAELVYIEQGTVLLVMGRQTAVDVGLVLATIPASVDRSPEGEDPEGLHAKHESAVPKADAQKEPNP